MDQPFRRLKTHIPSEGAQIYVEVIYPTKPSHKAVIFAHGLRSYFSGFLDRFALELVRAGFIAVKFHFVGTGHSTGEFKDKLNSVMLRNYEAVLDWVAALPEVRTIGVVARSNGAQLAIVHGADPRVQGYVMLGPPVFVAGGMTKFVEGATKRDATYFWHKSFKRPHTKGEGKLPLAYVDELAALEPIIQRNIPKVQGVMVIQSNTDEAVLWEEGHFQYLEAHLPEPKQMVVIPNTTHSFLGHKREVIQHGIGWLKERLA